MKLSVIIITLNEASHIGDCLRSVAFADEIIVLDSGSTDGTCDIARQGGAQVHSSPDWPGFGPQKNRALALATGDWVLSIDADERVTPELAQAIRREMAGPRADAFRIARLSAFGGRWIRQDISGTPPALDGHFLHYPYASLEAFITKINHYSTEAAQAMHARGKRTSAAGAVGHACWTFIRHYLLRRGFLDGRAGFVLAVMAATGSYYRYTKLLFLNRQMNRRPDAPNQALEKQPGEPPGSRAP